MTNYEPMKAVREFALKHSFPVNIDLNWNSDLSNSKSIISTGHALKVIATQLLMLYELEKLHDNATDLRLLRLHLILEEVGELCVALGETSDIDVIDACADILYVVYGLGVSYDYPLQEAFNEVHVSNMTKNVRKPDDTRLRDKGSEYVAPNIAKVLQMYKDNSHV